MIKWLKKVFNKKSELKEDLTLKDILGDNYQMILAQNLQDSEDIRLEQKAAIAGFKMYQDWCNYQFTTSAAFDRKYFGIKWPCPIMLCDLGFIMITEYYPAKPKHDTESLRKIAFEVCSKYQEEFKIEYGDYFKL